MPEVECACNPMNRSTRAGIVALVVAFLLHAQESAPANYRKARAAEIPALIPKLNGLAAWASGVQLFRERDRIYAFVLSLDSENAAARTGLGFKKTPDGSWTRVPDWREAKNSTEGPLPDLAARR